MAYVCIPIVSWGQAQLVVMNMDKNMVVVAVVVKAICLNKGKIRKMQ